MSILTRIRDKLILIVGAVEQKVDEIHEHFEKRRTRALAVELEKRAKGSPYTDWERSSRDLAFVLGEDGSFQGRKALWSDLECEGEYKGTAAQNMRLHGALLEDAARHGIPWPNEETAAG